MPIGTCDPATRGDSFNEGAMDIGPVKITYRYGWDGTSTKDVEPGCVGPLTRLTAVNTSATVTMYAHFAGKRGTPRTITLPPGFNQTYNQGQLGAAGFQDNTDLSGLVINDSPEDPVFAQKV